MIPPRKLNVSKCLSGGGTTVGDTVVVGSTVVPFVTGRVVGSGVVLETLGVVTGVTGEVGIEAGVEIVGTVDVCGDTGAGVGCEGLVSFDAGVVCIVGELVVVGTFWQCATAHSPQSSNPETSSFILYGPCYVRMKTWMRIKSK